MNVSKAMMDVLVEFFNGTKSARMNGADLFVFNSSGDIVDATNGYKGSIVRLIVAGRLSILPTGHIVVTDLGASTVHRSVAWKETRERTLALASGAQDATSQAATTQGGEVAAGLHEIADSLLATVLKIEEILYRLNGKK
mgnify:CR=1 FL=1